MRRVLFTIILAASLASLSIGQEVEVTSVFDTSRILVGDHTGYTITVKQPSGTKLMLPSFRDTLSKNIEIVSGPLTDTLMEGSNLKIVSRYIVTSFDSGRYQFPPVFAENRDNDNVRRFYSDYALLEVDRVEIAPADTTMKIFDIIKPYRAPITIGELLPWIFLVFLIAAVIWLSVRYFRKYWKKRPEEEILPDPDPAHVVAFRELEQLRMEELWQKGEVKAYYTRLTEILRKYLEKRFGVYSLEMTTSETLAELVKTGFRKDGPYKTLQEVLIGADLVKFAKYNPDPVENDMHYQNSWSFIESTKLEEPVLQPDSVNDFSAEGKK